MPEFAPVPSSAIVSTSASHTGHHALRKLRLWSTNKDLVSMVIVVCFAMGSAPASLRN
jgi:hypothetical protein